MIDHRTSAPRRILLVDDQESIHDAYRTILRNQKASDELDDLEDFLFTESASSKPITNNQADT